MHIRATAFGDSGEGYIRISYAASVTKLKTFVKALKQLKK